MTRKAKNPNRIHVSDRNLPGSIVCQTSTARNPKTTSAMVIRPLPAGLRSTRSPSLQNSWCTGEDSNLRSAKARQIYSLLPLTTRPPVHTLLTLLVSRRAWSIRKLPRRVKHREPRKRRYPEGVFRRPARPERAAVQLKLNLSTEELISSHWMNWSWRRDLNPRPSDYKSDALPAELRQPKQPSFALCKPYPQKISAVPAQSAPQVQS